MVLLFSLGGAALVGLYLLHYPFVRASVFDPSATFQYFVPLMVPMIAFMFEEWNVFVKLISFNMALII